MICIRDEFKLFKKKLESDYEEPLNDLYDIENKINNIDKTNKRGVMSIELLREELDEKNEQINSLKKELTNKENKESKFSKKVISVLDQIDNIHRFAIQSQNEALINNIKSIMKIVKKELREVGFEEIPTVGEIFNSELHECVEAIKDNSKNKYEIIDVVKKGYSLNGNVIRIAYVIAVK